MKRFGKLKNVIPAFIMVVILCGSMPLFSACKNDIPDDKDIENAVVTETTVPATIETPTSEKSDEGDGDGDGDNKGSFSDATNKKKGITMDEAINIALSRVPGATRKNLQHIEKERDDGHVTYKGEIYYNGLEYEFEIDASNGNILEWEIDD